MTLTENSSSAATQLARVREAVRLPAPATAQPKASERRALERRAMRNNERLVAAWLRSLSTR